jgi:aminoglycoside 3-N-acetyltransferase I
MSSRTPLVVRALIADDIDLLRELLAVFGEAFGQLDTYTSAPPGTPYLRKLLGGEQFIALAAIADNVVIGGLAAYELRKFEQAWSEVYIYDLAVASPYRRQGVATALIRGNHDQDGGSRRSSPYDVHCARRCVGRRRTHDGCSGRVRSADA